MTTKMAARTIDGLLVVDKPSGITSMDVVRRVKRASGLKKVGHGGTLDPIATGVIPVCLGQATRMMEYLVDGGKEYRGIVELGVQTDTYDAAGQVVGDPARRLPGFNSVGGGEGGRGAGDAAQ